MKPLPSRYSFTLSKTGLTLSCLRNMRRNRPCLALGLLGPKDQSRSGGRDPIGPNTFSSSKHPVSMSYEQKWINAGFSCTRSDANGTCGYNHFVLPAPRNASRVEFGVELAVRLVQNDSPQCAELLDVLHVIAVHQSGLKVTKTTYMYLFSG